MSETSEILLVSDDSKMLILDNFREADKCTRVINSEFRHNTYAKNLMRLANGVLPKNYKNKMEENK